MAGLLATNRYGGGGRYAGGGGLSGLFEGLGQGLSQFAKMTNDQDMENKKLQFSSAQEAARQAYEDNLNRFREGAQDKRQAAMIAAEGSRQDKTLAEQSADRSASRDIENKRLAQQQNFQNQEIGLRAQSEKMADAREQRHQAADDARNAKNDQAAQTNAVRTDLTDIKTQHNELSRNVSDAQKQVNLLTRTNANPDEINQAKSDLADAQKALTNFTQDSDSRRRQDLARIGTPDTSIPPDIAAKGPDFQALWKSGIAKGLDPIQLEQQLGKATPEDLQRAQKAAAVKGGPTSDTDIGGATDSIAPASADSSDFLADPNAPPSPVPAQSQTVAQAPAAGPGVSPPSVAETPPSQTPDQGAAPAPTPDLSQLASTLGQTAGGQAVNTTLQRLAESPTGPAADKMRRAAEIGLQDAGVDQDTATAYIDNYLSNSTGGAPDLNSMYSGGGQDQQAA